MSLNNGLRGPKMDLSISMPHYGQGIILRSLTWYESTTPAHFRALASSDTPDRSAPGWHVILSDVGDVVREAITSEEADQEIHRVFHPVRVSVT